MHRMKVKVGLAVGQSAPLAFGGPSEVELALRVPGRPDITVELCDYEGKARLKGTSLYAQPSNDVLLYFRLSGPSEEQVKVEVFHPTASIDVTPGVPERRFAVQRRAGSVIESTDSTEDQLATEGWTQDLPDAGTRQVFLHIAKYGAVTEEEATRMLGGARKYRRFSALFEDHCLRVPFKAGVEVVGVSKRHVRLRGEDA